MMCALPEQSVKGTSQYNSHCLDIKSNAQRRNLGWKPIQFVQSHPSQLSFPASARVKLTITCSHKTFPVQGLKTLTASLSQMHGPSFFTSHHQRVSSSAPSLWYSHLITTETPNHQNPCQLVILRKSFQSIFNNNNRQTENKILSMAQNGLYLTSA